MILHQSESDQSGRVDFRPKGLPGETSGRDFRERANTRDDVYRGVFTLGDARSFSGLTSKIPPLGSPLNFDADVKNKRPRITNVKTPLCLRDLAQDLVHGVHLLQGIATLQNCPAKENIWHKQCKKGAAVFAFKEICLKALL